MSGGTLDADESSTVSGALTQSGDIALDVADNKTLTYSGAAVSLGANTLTLSGGGTLGNTNAFVLNNANSKLLLNSITLDSASTSADSLGLDIDTNSTVTSLSVSHITPVSIAAGKSLSGAITVSAGSLKLNETGTLASTIAMSGGTLDADESSTVSGALSHTADIEIDVATSKTLTYSGTAISLGANTITLSGGGSLVSGGLTLNDADSKLLLNSITLDSASTSADSLGLDVDNNSTITALSVGHITPVSIAAGKSLSGAITVSAGSVKLDETGTLASTIAMSGGTLDADESSTVSGALSHTADIEIDVATNKTLTYSGSAISVGANILTLSGGGSLVSGGLTLNNADSKLLLNSITLDSVSTSADSLGLDVDNNSTITALSVGHITPVSIAAGKSLSGAVTVTAGSLKLNETGTLASTIAMSGGTLDSDESSTVSGALSHTADITIDVNTGKTLTYSGAAISIGANTITLSGGGTFSNVNNLVLSDPVSTLKLDGISTVANVSVPVALSTGKLDVDQNSVIQSFLNSGSSRVDILTGKNLSVTNGFEIPQNKSMELIGADGTLTLSDNLTLAGTLKFAVSGVLNSGTIYLNGGILDIDENITISSNLVHSADSSIDILTGKSIKYTGQEFNVEGLELTLTGGGIFSNTENLTLNDPASSLKLDGISEVKNVSIPAELTSGKLEIAENSTIDVLTHSGSSRFDINNTKVLMVSNAFEIPDNKSMELVGTGGGILSLTETLKLTGTLQFSAPDYSLKNGELELNNESLLDVDYHTIIDSDIVLLGNTTVDVAQGVSLEYRGNAIDLLNYQLTFLGSGTFLNTNAILISNSGSLLILAGDITIVLIEVTGNSAAGKGIRVKSAGASVTNLNLLADMGLTFIDDAYVLNVENLNVNSPAQLTGDGNGGWLKVQVLGQATANDVLTMHDINVSVEDEIDIDFEGQIVMTGNTIFDSIGGLTFNLNGAMNFNGTVTANINLNQGVMCITDNTTLIGNIRHRADSLIFIAPEAVLNYQGTNPLNVNDMTLAIQGGGRFSSWDNNSLTMNEDGGTLRLADNATTLSHLAFGANCYQCCSGD